MRRALSRRVASGSRPGKRERLPLKPMPQDVSSTYMWLPTPASAPSRGQSAKTPWQAAHLVTIPNLPSEATQGSSEWTPPHASASLCPPVPAEHTSAAPPVMQLALRGPATAADGPLAAGQAAAGPLMTNTGAFNRCEPELGAGAASFSRIVVVGTPPREVPGILGGCVLFHGRRVGLGWVIGDSRGLISGVTVRNVA